MSRGPSLIPWKDKTRKVKPWCVSIPPKLSKTGRRQRRFFATKEKAQGEIQRLKVRMENHGTAARLLTPAQEEQAASAQKLLDDEGIEATLLEVAGDYRDRWRQRNSSVTLSHAWAEYIKDMEKKGRSAVHIKNLKATGKKLSAIKDKLLTDITHADIEGCISDAAPSYRDALLRGIRAVLNFGMRGGRRWLAVNPVNDIDFAERKLGEVEIYTPEQIKKLLDATKDKYPELVPAVALMTFAGIRPDHLDGEIVRVDWSHVILKDKDKRIELPRSITKTGKQRTVKIRPALASWLQWHQKRGCATTGLICPDKGQPLRKKLTKIFKAAGVERIQDGLRHSFASYLAKTEGLDKAEQELGHQGNRALLNRHYRTDVSDAAAKKFWALRAPTS